jgi:hypothetical protein
MCGGNRCAATVSLEHEGDTHELSFFTSDIVSGGVGFGDAMQAFLGSVAGLSCFIPIALSDPNDGRPYCIYYRDITMPHDPWIRCVIFHFDGSSWKARILIVAYPESYFAGYYKEITIGDEDGVDCSELEATETIDRCPDDSGHEPTTTATLTITGA